jgi:hypothetical protein
MMNGEKIMSEYVWCHGPNCHTNHTVDRVRGSKGAKVLRTRKIKFYESRYNNFYNYFCSNGCYNDFAHQYAEQIVAIAPRPSHLKHRLIGWKKLNMKTNTIHGQKQE